MNPSITITTPRLTLREYLETDFPGIHAYSKDQETTRFMRWGPNTPEDTRKFIRRTMDAQSVEPRVDYFFVVCLKHGGQIIGGFGIHLDEDTWQCATIGYGFNKAYWGQGYATEATQALIQFGFSWLGMRRIQAFCDTRNLASARVMEKNQMQREALLDKHMWQKGEWRDSYLYAILADIWRDARSQITILAA